MNNKIKKIVLNIFILAMSSLSGCQIVNNYKLYRASYDQKKVFDETFNNYTEKSYGEIAQTFKIKYLGVGIHEAILTKNKIDNFCIIYDIKVPFLKNKFRIEIGYDSKRILSDNFYATLKDDHKFQHLYSEWVKKQIGCEDENVELKFISLDMEDKMSIDFNKINNISKNYDDLFANVKNFYCIEVESRNITNLTTENSENIANNLRTEILLKAINITRKPNCNMNGHISLSNKEFNKGDLNIYYRYDIKNDNERLELCNY